MSNCYQLKEEEEQNEVNKFINESLPIIYLEKDNDFFYSFRDEYIEKYIQLETKSHFNCREFFAFTAKYVKENILSKLEIAANFSNFLGLTKCYIQKKGISAVTNKGEKSILKQTETR